MIDKNLIIDGFHKDFGDLNSDKMQPEAPDCAAVVEDFSQRTNNLPNEIAFYRAEGAEKDRLIQIYTDGITQRDNAIQKFIKSNHSTTANPKEAAMREWVEKAYDTIDTLQDEKIALAAKLRLVVDRHVKGLDAQMGGLIARGELTVDDDFPSLLRPEGDQAAEKLKTLNKAAASESRLNAIASNQAAAVARAIHQSGVPRSQNQAPSTQASSALSTPLPGTPAATLLLQNRQREASTGTANKRQRLTGSLGTLPANPSGLARHSSVTPGTPKPGTPTGERADSVGPRPPKSTTSKKTAPHQQKSLVKKKGSSTTQPPTKSSLNRVKKPGRSTPNSTNDSELSDAETMASIDDDEAVTPGARGGTNELDDEDAADDRKYCTCQRISFGDMVACDNENCPKEWFHWQCVGLTTEPDGSWFCPECLAEREKERTRTKKGQKL